MNSNSHRMINSRRAFFKKLSKSKEDLSPKVCLKGLEKLFFADSRVEASQSYYEVQERQRFISQFTQQRTTERPSLFLLLALSMNNKNFKPTKEKKHHHMNTVFIR